MRRSLELFTLAILVASLLPATAYAQRSDDLDMNRIASGELGKAEEVVKSPEEQAVDHYNQGIALIQRADKLMVKADTQEGAKREKALKKVTKALKGAALEFTTATVKNEAFAEAYSLLGYAQSRLGQHEAAVAAFDTAIQLQPNDLRSMDAKGRSLLALGQVDEAKQVYLTLSRMNRDQAQGLLQAMAAWAADREADPAAVDLASWIQQVRSNS